MNAYGLRIEMELLKHRLNFYERKYGVLSENFYESLTSGRLASNGRDEVRIDFGRWKGVYETWLWRRQNMPHS